MVLHKLRTSPGAGPDVAHLECFCSGASELNDLTDVVQILLRGADRLLDFRETVSTQATEAKGS